MFTVTHPKAGDIDFPDGTTDEDIAKAMRQLDAETAGNNSHPQPGHGMGDLKMAESRPQPRDVNQFGETFGHYAMKPIKFLGDAATSLSTGPINAVAQGIQDHDPLQIPKNLVKSTFNPVANLIGKPFQNQIQETSKTLERAGVPNEKKAYKENVPGFLIKQWARTGENGYKPENAIGIDENKLYTKDAVHGGLADDLGTAADMLAPFPYAKMAKPIANAVEYGARELAGPVGRGMQKVAVMQAKSAIPINIPFARKGAESETFLKENLLSGGKNKAYEKSSELSKDLGNQVVGIIEQGKNEGKTIDGIALIDNLKAKNTSGAIETKEGIRLLEPASKRVLDKAEKIIRRMSQDGDGRINVKQANAVKQWLQKQADYPGQALAQGLPLTAEADAAGLTAADLGHEFRTAIESKVPEVKDLNARLSKIIPAKQAAGWKQAVRDRQELVPLKALVAVTADIAASKGAALGLLAMNTAWKSGRISQTMYNLGSKLIKAGSITEKAKIENAMEKAVSKGIIKNDEIEALKAQLEPGKRPFLSSIVGPDELPPRSPQGRFALDKPETFVPRLGSTESPFGPPTPEAPAQFDPLEDMYPKANPSNRPALPTQPYDGMEPPEMLRARQEDAQASREAFVRQGRERGIGLPAKPFEPDAGPDVRVISRPPKILQPRKPIGDIQSNFPPVYNENPKVAQVLDQVQGRRSLGSETDKIKSLKAELERVTTKEAKQRVLAQLRAENYRTPLKDLLPEPSKYFNADNVKELKSLLAKTESKVDKQKILKLIREENMKAPLNK